MIYWLLSCFRNDFDGIRYGNINRSFTVGVRFDADGDFSV